MRLAVVLLAVLLAIGGSGWGQAGDLRARREQVRGAGGARLRERGQELRDRAEQARDRAERSARRVADRVRAALDRLEQSVPQAPRDNQAPASGNKRLEAYLKEVLDSVDTYWTRTLKAADVPEPRVSFLW